MKLYLLSSFLITLFTNAYGQSTSNSGDMTINGVKCCYSLNGPCTPGLPLCESLINQPVSNITATPSPITPICQSADCTGFYSSLPQITSTPSSTQRTFSNLTNSRSPLVTSTMSPSPSMKTNFPGSISSVTATATATATATVTTISTTRPTITPRETPTSSSFETRTPVPTPRETPIETRTPAPTPRETPLETRTPVPTPLETRTPVPTPRETRTPQETTTSFMTNSPSKTVRIETATKPTTTISILPRPSSIMECCNPLITNCLFGMTICRLTPSPIASIIPKCCDPTIMRCDTNIPLCPSTRPYFSAKPSSIPIAPTQYFDVSSILQATKQPSSSPWIIENRVNLTELGIPRPEAIAVKLSLAINNVSSVTQPRRLQELQIRLACTYRVPLEQIRITNITMVAENRLVPVEFDKTIASLKSNGTVVCLAESDFSTSSNVTSSNVTSSSRRNLQVTSLNTVNIDYAIIDPTDDILSLNDAQFSQITASTQMNTFVSSVGAVYLDQSISAMTAPSTNPSINTNSNTSINSGLAIGLGIGGFFAMTLLVVGAISVIKKREKKARLVNTVIVKNPVEEHKLVAHPKSKLSNMMNSSAATSTQKLFFTPQRSMV